MPDARAPVYLDHAATSAPRPAAVTHAITEFLEHVGATPGRGGHRLAVEAGRIALRCRLRCARLLGLPGDPGRIAFMLNATHAINTALYGLLEPGDVLVVTALDHNAVLRPAEQLSRERRVRVRLVPVAQDGSLDEVAFERALEGARLAVVNAASNVLGTAFDAAAMIRAAHAAGALALVDVAQSAGHASFDAAAIDADLVAFTGHKGLLGPQGIGGLWVRAGIDVAPLLTGGTGGDSLSRDMPSTLPDHLEAGTQNSPAMAGVAAGIDWLLGHGMDRLHARLMGLKRSLIDGFLSLDGIRVRSPLGPAGVPIVTVTADRVDPAAFAARLDREHGVLTRPGLHCAPEAHRVLGTQETGAVRFSFGWNSTEEDVARAVEAVAHVAGAGRFFASAGAS